MGQAKIYRRVNGKKITKFIATLPGVQAYLTYAVNSVAALARAELAYHRHQGHSEIRVDRGEVDRYLLLNDERGQLAAMSIEYGRGPTENGAGGMDGLFILHHATHLPIKHTMPRSKRKKKYYTKSRRK